MIKSKNVAFYISNGYGGLMAVSKNAETRLRKKIKKGFKGHQTFSMPLHKIKKK